jgi:hypothetical protein
VLLESSFGDPTNEKVIVVPSKEVQNGDCLYEKKGLLQDGQ